jgi:hypothetical protein
MSDLPATRRARRVAALAVAVLAALAYANSLADGFVLDDTMAIVRNEVVAHPTLGGVFARDFRGGVGGARTDAYRPLATASFALDRALGGGRPALFHATNLFLHALLCALLTLALWSVEGLSRRAAVAAAALFAVHPLHTDAVTALVGRADLLGAGFALAAWWLHRRDARLNAIAAPACLFLALCAKESSVVILPVMALVELRGGAAAPRARPWRWLAYGAVVAAWLLLRAHAIGGWHAPAVTSANPLGGASLWTRERTALALFARALGLLVWPAALVPDYGRAVVVPLAHVTAASLAGGLALAALAALVVLAWRRRAPWSDATLLLVVPGLFAVNAIVPLPGSFAERWWYLPSLGACVLAAAALDLAAARARPWLPALLFAMVVGALALRTVARNRDWRDNPTLFAACVATAPASALCQYSLGVEYDARARDGDALQCYERAAALDPDWAEPHAAAATLHARAGRLDEAAAAFAAMQRAGGASHAARLNYVRFLLRTGRRAEAERELESLQRASP